MDITKQLQRGESFDIEFKEGFSRDIPKVVSAMSNTLGGHIFLGVNDQGKIVGLKSKVNYREKIAILLQNLSPLPDYKVRKRTIKGKVIVIITVPKVTGIVSYRNTVYIRNQANNYPLSVQELFEKGAENLLVAYDRNRSPVKEKDIDKDLFERYLRIRSEVRGVKINKRIDNVSRLGFARNGYLTNAGVLCFTEVPQDHLSNSGIRIVLFKGDNKSKYVERVELSGNLHKMVDDAENFLESKFTTIAGYRIGFRQKLFSNYPVEAVREAILNAVIHRNYYDESDIRIYMYRNKLEIINPGSFPPGVTLENPLHKPRNSILSQYFFDLGYVEQYGSGIDKIKEQVAKYPFIKLEYDLQTYSTAVRFVQDLTKIKLDEIDQNILTIIKIKPSSTSEIAAKIDLSRQATVERINDLKSLGYIKDAPLTSGPTTRYEIVDSTDKLDK